MRAEAREMHAERMPFDRAVVHARFEDLSRQRMQALAMQDRVSRERNLLERDLGHYMADKRHADRVEPTKARIQELREEHHRLEVKIQELLWQMQERLREIKRLENEGEK